jgi:cell division protein FtsN
MKRNPERKSYQKPASGRRSRGSTLLGVFLGLILGVLLSLGVVWYMNKMPLPFRDKAPRADRTTNGDADQPGTPKALPGKPGDKVGARDGDKPRFEFYKILPGSQEAAPAAKPAEVKPAEARASDSKSPDTKQGDAKSAGEPLYLQVGAFQKPTDADNLKARLALLGLDASVQEVDVAEKGRMYRVRTGPFSNVEELNRARGQLSQNGIQTAPTKGK